MGNSRRNRGGGGSRSQKPLRRNVWPNTRTKFLKGKSGGKKPSPKKEKKRNGRQKKKTSRRNNTFLSNRDAQTIGKSRAYPIITNRSEKRLLCKPEQTPYRVKKKVLNGTTNEETYRQKKKTRQGFLHRARIKKKSQST